MDSHERQEIRELRDRIIKLETMIELEFKHMREDWKAACESIQKLNEEYGRLIEKQATLEIKHSDLEAKFKESIGNWKLAALIVSPIVTTVVVLAIQFFLRIPV